MTHAKRSLEAKKGKPASDPAQKATPWEAAGLSRRTYFRRKAAGEPIEARQKPVPAPRVPRNAKPAPKPAPVSVKPVPVPAKTSAKAPVPSERQVAPISSGEKPADPNRNERGRFKPGNLANPAGRPKGTRNKLTEDFVAVMCEDFREHGAGIVEKVRTEKPDVYLRVLASMIPKQVETGEPGVFADMSDDELQVFIDDAAAQLGFIKPGAMH